MPTFNEDDEWINQSDVSYPVFFSIDFDPIATNNSARFCAPIYKSIEYIDFLDFGWPQDLVSLAMLHHGGPAQGPEAIEKRTEKRTENDPLVTQKSQEERNVGGLGKSLIRLMWGFKWLARGAIDSII